MLAKVKCIAFKGLDVVEVDVEVSISTRNLPAFDIVGLPNKSVEESKHRVKSAFINSGYKFPEAKITVNLAPADLNKVGSSYDLPVAVGIYCAKNNVCLDNKTFFFGELSLDALLRPTRGVYLAADYVNKINGTIYISYISADYFRDFSNSTIYLTRNFTEVIDSITGARNLAPYTANYNSGVSRDVESSNYDSLFSDIIGQESAKRALEISAAGGHNLLMVGSPGTGKSMLAKAAISILPKLSDTERREVRRIYSYIGRDEESVEQRPFREPHHTISYSGMIGGGADLVPGEITLAHNGILFMDEFCEFSRNVLEALRQPMQDGAITLTRNNKTFTFPSGFTLLAASNPCPCGYLGHSVKQCVCTEQRISSYAKKLSGPLADRFDLFASLYPEDRFIESTGVDNTKTFIQTCGRIKSARFIQQARLYKYAKNCNASLTNRELAVVCRLDSPSKQLLNAAYKKLNFSPRAYFKIIKVARTIADLEQCSEISQQHIAEAIQYRQR